MSKLVDLLKQAQLLYQSGKFENAARTYSDALAIEPDNPDATCFLGLALARTGRAREAIALLRRDVDQHPHDAQRYCNLGELMTTIGLAGEAIPQFQKALQFNPKGPRILFGLGAAYRDIGDSIAAIECFQLVLKYAPAMTDAYVNIGFILLRKRQIEEAQKYFDRALKINPGLVDAHRGRGFSLLLKGNYLEGWKDFEWRLRDPLTKTPIYPVPEWDGSSLEGKTLLVVTEQGVGDEIMFASCLPDLVNTYQPRTCIVDCEPRLVSLFSRSFPEIQFHGKILDTSWLERYPPIDCQIRIGSLPGFLRPDEASFSKQESYLVPDATRIATWKDRYSSLGPGHNIGISWRGGVTVKGRRKRSAELEQWLPLLSIPGINYINLQYGDCSQELAAFEHAHSVRIHHWPDMDPLSDLDDFSAQVKALDLVISIDNSTIHMAGAVGTPFWALLTRPADWRWLVDGENTPWYSNGRLIRQMQDGAWDTLFESVRIDLLKKL